MAIVGWKAGVGRSHFLCSSSKINSLVLSFILLLLVPFFSRQICTFGWVPFVACGIGSSLKTYVPVWGWHVRS